MAKSSRENEIKLAFPATATQALIQAGASTLRSTFEDTSWTPGSSS
jgi:hypothetical protein